MLKLKTFIVGYYQTNCYVLHDEDTKQTIIIDPGDNAGVIIEYLKNKQLDLVAILLTHGHFDHVLAVNEIKNNFPNAKIYYHKEASIMLLDNKKKYQVINFEFDNVVADKYVEDNEELNFGNINIKVLYTPGHSNGSVCYICNDDYIFCGDVLFLNSYGATHFYGGNLSTLANSIKKIFQLNDKILYCGHGNSTSLNYERINNPINEFYK